MRSTATRTSRSRSTISSARLDLRRLLLQAAVAGCVCSTAGAASIWTGPGGAETAPTSGGWSVDAHWSPAVAPVGSATTDLSFSLAADQDGYTATQDISESFTFRNLSFNNASTAETITLAASASHTTPQLVAGGTTNTITHNGDGTVIVEPSIYWSAGSLAFDGTGTGTMILQRGITIASGIGALTGFNKTSSNTLVVNGITTGRPHTISAGTLVLTARADVTANRPFVVQSGGTLQLGIAKDVSYTGITTDTAEIQGFTNADLGLVIDAGGVVNVNNTGTNATNRLFDSGTIEINGALNFIGHESGSTEVIGHIRGNGSIDLSNYTLELGGGSVSPTFVFGGHITGNGKVIVTKNNKAFTGGNSTYSGGTELKGGRMELGADSTFEGGVITKGPLGTGTVTFLGGVLSADGTTPRTLHNAITAANEIKVGDGTNSGKLTLAGTVTLQGDNRTINTSSDVEVSGVIGQDVPSRKLTKKGLANLILSNGFNSYTGGTTVSEGTLLANNTSGPSATGTGAVTVASGATLGGTGSIAGATTIQNGGILAPGDIGGTESLSFGDNLTFQGTTSSARFTIAGTNRGAVNNGYDAVDVAGKLTYAGLLVIDSASEIANSTYDLFSFASFGGTLTGVSLNGFHTATFASDAPGVWTVSVGGKTFTFEESTGDLVVVPEPALAGVVSLVGLALARRRRV